MGEWLARHLFYPLWAWWEGSCRVRRYHELQKRQWWPLERLQKEQWDQAQKMLRHAATHSPYYRSLFSEKGIDISKLTTPEQWLALPVTRKSDLQSNLQQFIADDVEKEALVTAKTGGSTGHSLFLYFDDRCQQMRNGAAMRTDSWAGRFPGVKTAALWGNPVPAKGVKGRLRALLHDRVFVLDTMKMDPDSIGQFVSEWHRQKGKVIFGHAHSIFLLAEYLLKTGDCSVRPKGIIATSMMLPQPEREVIERCFASRVTDRYGCEEVGLIASECECHDGMHLNIDDLYIEFVDEHDKPVAPGLMGKILVTDLNNYGMPLLRYEVGDWGVPSEKICSCGRGLPLMDRLVGRSADFLKKSDGSQVAGISLIERTLTAFEGIAQLQLIQNRLDQIDINLVKKADAVPDTEQALIDALKSVFGDSVTFTINQMENIPQEANGKYRFSICRV